ncbi:MAG: DMT family transporter [Lentisphaeria bacterium]|nr:MAG: DMT family transporter [Lentisphaeria bacterium]
MFGALTIPLMMPFTRYPGTWNFALLMLLCVLSFVAGQYGFFQTLREVEASRLSSLLGLKIVILAFFTMLLTRTPLHFLQWIAVILCSVAAIGMNFTGGRISWRAAFWLTFMLVTYSICDMIEAELILQMRGSSLIADSTAVAGLMYFILGILTLPCLLKCRFRLSLCKDALPYALTWYCAIILLFLCYGSIGAVFGNIIQASRGDHFGSARCVAAPLRIRTSGASCGPQGVVPAVPDGGSDDLLHVPLFLRQDADRGIGFDRKADGHTLQFDFATPAGRQ